jgi:hypothetical protein
MSRRAKKADPSLPVDNAASTANRSRRPAAAEILVEAKTDLYKADAEIRQMDPFRILAGKLIKEAVAENKLGKGTMSPINRYIWDSYARDALGDTTGSINRLADDLEDFFNAEERRDKFKKAFDNNRLIIG